MYVLTPLGCSTGFCAVDEELLVRVDWLAVDDVVDETAELLEELLDCTGFEDEVDVELLICVDWLTVDEALDETAELLEAMLDCTGFEDEVDVELLVCVDWLVDDAALDETAELLEAMLDCTGFEDEVDIELLASVDWLAVDEEEIGVSITSLYSDVDALSLCDKDDKLLTSIMFIELPELSEQPLNKQTADNNTANNLYFILFSP